VKEAVRRGLGSALRSADRPPRPVEPDGPPENSLGAFQAACAAGYGIELDVQLSADGEAMVFHDARSDRG
jgi:glycerophosphoryl diester phosphodiesterase